MSPLENGKRPDLIVHNSKMLLRYGLPLIETASTATAVRSVTLPPIIVGDGTQFTGQSLFVVTSTVNGAVVLGKGTRRGEYEAHFSWHVHYNRPDTGIAEIEPDMDVYTYKSVGIGRAIFQLGMNLVHKIGPLLPDREVFCTITDGSDGWTPAAMERFSGFERQENIFIKRLK